MLTEFIGAALPSANGFRTDVVQPGGVFDTSHRRISSLRRTKKDGSIQIFFQSGVAKCAYRKHMWVCSNHKRRGFQKSVGLWDFKNRRA